MSCHVLLPPYKKKCLSHREVHCLSEVYSALYPGQVLKVSHFVQRYKHMFINGEEFLSTAARSQQSSFIVAHWLSGSSMIDSTGKVPLRVGSITSFFCTI